MTTNHQSIRIAVIVGGGMGGTEKAAHLYAAEMSNRGHEVEALTDPDGCRSELLLKAGVRIRQIELSIEGLVAYLRDFKPQILHNHTSGYSDNSVLYTALRALGPEKPKLVETNVFGQLLDYANQDDVDMRLFITFTSGMQAFSRTRIIQGPPDPSLDTVVFYPLPSEAFTKDEVRRIEFRKNLGVGEDEFLAVRTGRPGPKWEPWECEAFQEARRKNPKLRLFLMEPKDSIQRDISAGKYGDGIIVKPATADPDYLLSVYSAADLMLQASSWGESFGYTLAEGMAVGMPLITLSTPWGDQAQTELVKHGETGYVCRSVKGMALALTELSTNPEKSAAFGAAGRERIHTITSLEHEGDLLEQIFKHLITGNPSSLMDERFSDWTKFIESKSKQTSPECYEADLGLTFILVRSSIYDAFRKLKHVVKYVIMKSKGFPVYPLKWKQ